MADLVFQGNRQQLVAKIRTLGPMLAGKAPDPAGIVLEVLQQVGLVVLGNVTDAFVEKSQGGTDEMGITWPALSPVTLALRRRGSGAKLEKRLRRELKDATPGRRTLIATHFRRLQRLYEADRLKDRPSRKARRFALRLAKLMRPYLAAGRYEKLRKDLSKDLPRTEAKKAAFFGAFALILRDTGRLLNSLSPQIASPDRVLRIMPGAVTVGSNVRTKSGIRLLDLHNSSAPRKQKKAGGDRLPRRQILPDKEKPMPKQWIRDIAGAVKTIFKAPLFWSRFLGS